MSIVSLQREETKQNKNNTTQILFTTLQTLISFTGNHSELTEYS